MALTDVNPERPGPAFGFVQRSRRAAAPADTVFDRRAAHADFDAQPQASPISVERAEGARLAEIENDWRDLIARSLEPNVFMDPALLLAAERHLSGRRLVTLLAWQGGPGRRLIGLWAFAVATAPQSLLPLHVLLSPPVPHGYLATPALDATAAEGALQAMLDFVAAAGDLPDTIVLDKVGADGPAMRALERVLRARGNAPFAVTEAKRPLLESDLDGKSYLEQALSSGSRKKLRQHRRRLAEKGELTFKMFAERAAVAAAFEEFLALEAAGWKGLNGTALLCDAAEAAYARDMIAGLAAHGAAAIHALVLDGRAVSMQVVLRAGSVAFTWKTAYDETLHDVSPGMLLLEDYTTAFLADAQIARVDSCAYDESSFMAAWRERQAVVQVWIDARPGGSPAFHVLCRLQKAYLKLRASAKQRYLSWRRKWKTK